MAVMSERRADIDTARGFSGSLREASAVNRSGRVFLGTILLISSVGLWLVPVDAADAAMQLITLFFSLCLIILGAMFIFSAADQAKTASFELDLAAREIRVVRATGKTAHKMRDLVDVALKDQRLTARTVDGALHISLPIPDKRVEQALRAALFEVA